MSTLTKICIVLVFVLSLLGCAVFIQKVATDDNWKENAIGQRARANLSEAHASNQALAAQTWRELYVSQHNKASDLEEKRREDIGSKDRQISQLVATNGELQGQMKELEHQFENLDATLKLQIQIAKTLSDKLGQERTAKTDLQNKLRGAEDQLKEYLTQIDSLKKSLRVQEEKISDLEERNVQLAERHRKLINQFKVAVPGVEIEAVAEAAPVPEEKIDGSVIAVKEQLASLNVGAKDKVKKDMVFIIYRGAEFVGHLRVADVYSDNCAGIVYENIRDVQVGDKATTKLLE